MPGAARTYRIVRWLVAGVGAVAVAGVPAAPHLGAQDKASQIAADPAEIAARVEKARAAVQAFAARLQGELSAALKAGGPVGAIAACAVAAPAVASGIAETSSFEVGRTALRLRNPENAPDDWETAVLQEFARKLAAGADAATLEHHEVVQTGDGDRIFRYMKAIPLAAEPCQLCHGVAVAPDVMAAIRAQYPADAATGFKPGELRGAFTLAKPLD